MVASIGSRLAITAPTFVPPALTGLFWLVPETRCKEPEEQWQL